MIIPYIENKEDKLQEFSNAIIYNVEHRNYANVGNVIMKNITGGYPSKLYKLQPFGTGG
jgi:hypothetical protein